MLTSTINLKYCPFGVLIFEVYIIVFVPILFVPVDITPSIKFIKSSGESYPKSFQESPP